MTKLDVRCVSLFQDNELIRLGYGLYAKSRINPLTGSAMIAAKGGFDQVAKEALKRLGIEYQGIAKEISDNLSSTQIPANTVVQIDSRFNRKISVDDKFKLKVA